MKTIKMTSVASYGDDAGIGQDTKKWLDGYLWSYGETDPVALLVGALGSELERIYVADIDSAYAEAARVDGYEIEEGFHSEKEEDLIEAWGERVHGESWSVRDRAHVLPIADQRAVSVIILTHLLSEAGVR